MEFSDLELRTLSLRSGALQHKKGAFSQLFKLSLGIQNSLYRVYQADTEYSMQLLRTMLFTSNLKHLFTSDNSCAHDTSTKIDDNERR